LRTYLSIFEKSGGVSTGQKSFAPSPCDGCADIDVIFKKSIIKIEKLIR